jgi:hypothetical protein
VSTKPTGLSAFTRKGAAAEQPAPVASPVGRKRAQGDTVALTVRLPRAEWARLHQLAVAQSTSLQALAVEGFDAVLGKQGLPPIRLDVKAS